MEKYNYYDAVKEDVKNYISENVTLSDYEDRDSLEEFLNDELWIEDSVTGNASGSYTFSAWEAEENLCHNLELIEEVQNEFGPLKFSSPENVDVSIRCYLLGSAISEVLDELEDEKEK